MSRIQELIVDAYGCTPDLSDAKVLEKAARAAVESVGAQVVEVAVHRFQPHGLTLCLILKESHFIISTWPEHHFAITNIFLCNPEMSTRAVWEAFKPSLRPTKEIFHVVRHDIARTPTKKAS